MRSEVRLSVGDRIQVTRNELPEGAELGGVPIDRYAFADFERRSALAWLALAFVALVLVTGRWRGLRALLGLALSIVIVVEFVVPAILEGASPVGVALVGALAIMLTTIPLEHGVGAKAIAAVLGTTVCLLLTAGLASLFTDLAHLTGFASEESVFIRAAAGDLSIQGLLLAGMVIGALGVLDDLTVSQSSTVMALRRANPGLSFARLVREALDVGHDHIAATVNTLVLAYVGAALPIILIFTIGQTAAIDAVNLEAVAAPIVATLVGSIGLIAAVRSPLPLPRCSRSGFPSGLFATGTPPIRTEPRGGIQPVHSAASGAGRRCGETRRGRMTPRVGLKLVALVCATAAVFVATANAITFGEPDEGRHPNVGALVADWNEESPGPDEFCTGTLVSSTLFLTAAHCMVDWPEGTEFFVTFSEEYDEDAASPSGLVPVESFTIHESFGQPGGGADAFDIAIVELEVPQSATPAELPELGLLDELSQQELRGLQFTTVGYGIVRESKTGGPHGFIDEVNRLVAQQTLLSLQPTWLTLNMNPSTGSGGTCYGDSGGPHFLGGMTSNLIVSLTVTGDAMCRATDKTYRLDTVAAQEFLSRFGLVPAP